MVIAMDCRLSSGCRRQLHEAIGLCKRDKLYDETARQRARLKEPICRPLTSQAENFGVLAFSMRWLRARKDGGE